MYSTVFVVCKKIFCTPKFCISQKLKGVEMKYAFYYLHLKKKKIRQNIMTSTEAVGQLSYAKKCS